MCARYSHGLAHIPYTANYSNSIIIKIRLWYINHFDNGNNNKKSTRSVVLCCFLRIGYAIVRYGSHSIGWIAQSAFDAQINPILHCLKHSPKPVLHPLPPISPHSFFIYRQFPFMLNANCFSKCWTNIIRVEIAKWIVTRSANAPKACRAPVGVQTGRSNMPQEQATFCLFPPLFVQTCCTQIAFAKINTSKEMVIYSLSIALCVCTAYTERHFASCSACVFVCFCHCHRINEWNRICVNANRCHV